MDSGVSPPSATQASRPGVGRGVGGGGVGHTRSHPGSRQRKQAGPEGASPPYISRSPGGLRVDPRVSPTVAIVLERRRQGNTCRGRMRWALGSTHLRTGGARVRRGPRSPDPLCRDLPRGRGARWGKGTRQLRHLPGSTYFPASGSNRADNPWHHLPPPPRPRRRLPTAHPAQATDTTAGVPVPAAAPNSGREGGV